MNDRRPQPGTGKAGPLSLANAAIARFRDRGNRYIATFIWLLSDSIVAVPRQWRRIMLATMLNLASNAAIVGVIYFYVSLLQAGAEIAVFGLTISVRSSQLALSMFILLLTLALLAFSFSDYTARASALRLHRRYFEYSADRAYLLLNRLPIAACATAAASLNDATTKKLISSYSHACGWSLRFIGTAFPNAVIFVFGYLSLLWLDATTTILITILGVLLILSQYPIHLLAAHSSNTVDATTLHFSQQNSALLSFVRSYKSGRTSTPLLRRLDSFRRDEKVRRYANADEDRYRAMELSGLWTQTGGGLILAVMLLTVGSGLLSDTADWAILIVYATLLRRLLGGMTAILRAITMFSRFSPKIQQYRLFVEDFNCAPAGSPLGGQADVTLSLRGKQLDGIGDVLTIPSGAVVTLLGETAVDRGVALALQAALDRGMAGAQHVGVPEIKPIISPPTDPDARRRWLESEKALRIIEGALEDFREQPGIVLLIDRDVWSLLSAERRGYWLSEIMPGFVVVGAGALDDPVIAGQPVLLVEPFGLVYWCTADGERLSGRQGALARRRLQAMKAASAAPVDGGELIE